MSDEKNNTGFGNTGFGNTGHCNTGYRNTGYRNTADRNTGDCNTGDCNTGMFNTNEPNMRMFNAETDIKYSDFLNSDKFPSFNNFGLTTWISEEMMTEEEKVENPTYKTTEGYLKSFDYKTAWSIFWRKTSEENKKKFFDLPNFCPKIFEEITGIDIEERKVELTLEEIAPLSFPL